MPGRTPQEAFDAFVEPLKEAIACVAHAKITVSPDGSRRIDVEHQLTLNRATSVPLKGDVNSGKGPRITLELGVRMRYKIIRDPNNGPYRATVLAYDHELTQASGEAIVNFHWHPDGSSHVKTPHLHVGSSQLAPHSVLSNKIHMPTGRVSLERVVRQAIELGVKPLVDDWKTRLDTTEAQFVQHRTWE